MYKKYKIIKKRAETMKKKDDEIYAALKQRNLDLSLQRMESYLKDENYVSVLLILKNIFDNIKVKSALMVSSKECPVSLRPPLDSIIYASSRLKLEELNDLIDKIKQMYGENYINKAKNNEDEIVNQNTKTIKNEHFNECQEILSILKKPLSNKNIRNINVYDTPFKPLLKPKKISMVGKILFDSQNENSNTECDSKKLPML